MKAANKNSDPQKNARLPIYLTHFGFFPMNANGQVGSLSAPINIEQLEGDKKQILETSKKMQNVLFFQ